MLDLFDYAEDKDVKNREPLAARMRPETLEEYVGQEQIIAPGKLLYRAIKADRLSSIILYGPPGTGKTTLAHVSLPTAPALPLNRSMPLQQARRIWRMW